MDRNLPDTLCTIFLETQKPKRLSFGHQSVLKSSTQRMGAKAQRYGVSRLSAACWQA